MLIDDIKIDVEKVFDSTLQAECCRTIIDYIVCSACNENVEFTYISFSRILKLHGVPSELIEAISFLSGPKWNVLEVHFVYIDEDDTEHPLPKSEVNEAIKTGRAVHPYTGNMIDDPLRNIVAYFKPSPEFIRKACK